ncbi:glycoside hydrolase family 2 protein [Bacillus solitudinis]|uniref:glycoside hydrolase family 2 protein n=1 Tax=Bacillus solitudinis TaxID=2014074 RepID=UPI000C244AFD|nr:glycoside hydrolase family 2 TIM barrel-domain containing protein [Bacillus solitudinis]
MLRLFETHKVRKQQELSGLWDFAKTDSDEINPAYSYQLPVPGCWEMHPDLLTYRGKGQYRTFVNIERKSAIRLEFKGVSHTAEVYFKGILVAEHYNAYTPFSTVINDVEPGRHEIVVKVDNSFSEKSSLHIPNDYYTYGGIIRPISIEEIASSYIERIAFTPEKVNGVWQAEVEVITSNLAEKDMPITLKGLLDEHPFDIGTTTIPAKTNGMSLTKKIIFGDVTEWSHEKPQLYLLDIQLFLEEQEFPSDDLIERVGFRTVTTKNERIQINDKDVVLKGFNRHEDHPLVGASFPLQLMIHDLDLMIDMGANSVRTSHYPNDEIFLDLCDERGILVWEENHARGLSLEQMQNPYFAKQCDVVNREMVENHYNHPSIIIWAILNECASNTEEGRIHYKTQLEQIRSLDHSRPLSFASHHRDKELCFDLVDIVSLNLYPQWYGDEDPGDLVDASRLWANQLGGNGKPLIMSEFGGDGFYGFRSPTKVKGSEERQVDIIEKNLEAYTQRDFVSGMYIWQFCDCRVTEEGSWPLMRAQTQNSKGIVDAYRRPKLAYSTVKKYFKEATEHVKTEPS